MSGTFSSLSSALSALRYNQTAMDVASNNVANANTVGYTRRQVIAQSTGAPSVPALWSRWEGASGGVEVSSINRMVDPLLDHRARSEHANLSFSDTRSLSLTRIETALNEPGDNGVAAALGAYQAAWHDVANNPGDPASRTQLLARGETLRSTIAAQGKGFADEWADQRIGLAANADEVNQVSGQLADLNRGLRAANIAGTDANTLLDQRDQLTQRLAELTGAAVTVNSDTTVDVAVGGQALVTGNTAVTIAVSGSADLAGAGGNPVTVTVGGVAVALPSGEMGGRRQLLSADLPGHVAALDSFVATMAASVNAQHAAGVDLDSAAGGDFWSGSTAATLQVAITDPRAVAAADASLGGLDNSNANRIGDLDMGGGSYRNLVTSFGILVSTSRQGATNQASLVAQVDSSRESLSGVSTDEEMVNLLAAQHGYEAAAKVLTVMDSMLDTLINRTGLR